MISKFFIERPVLSNVIAILMILIGGVALSSICAVAQYPDVVPPTVQVTTRYPGASAPDCDRHRGTADRAAGQRRRGHALYAVLQRRRRHLHPDGDLQDRHRPQFRAGAGAEPRLQRRCRNCRPRCRTRASRCRRRSTSILLFVTLTSPNKTYDSLFLSNYATINIRDELSRLPGVGNVTVFGAGQYSMRVWLDPNKLQARGLTAAGRHPGDPAAEPAGHGRAGRRAAGAAGAGFPVYARTSTAGSMTRASLRTSSSRPAMSATSSGSATSARSSSVRRPTARCSR
jgi:HAE1 family hydrophobic/amphiphilic exporter-1